MPETTSQRISRIAAEADELDRQGAAYARRVSAKLSRAGVPKASRYKPFGSDVDGFVVSHNLGRVAVLFTSRKIGLAWHDKVEVILTDAGFTIARKHRIDRSFDTGGFTLAARPARPRS